MKKYKTRIDKKEFSESDVLTMMKLCRRGFVMADVAQFIGMARSTLYERLKERPDIRSRLNTARQSFHLELANMARKMALSGDRDLIKFLLTRRFNYRETQEIELNPGGKQRTKEELIEEILKLVRRNDLIIPDEGSTEYPP